ncbi:MAG: hypothetical protein HW412_199, partial [Bacteroidetes bacterium]|nr:hypothetical protein [Bacteroidota bacterium]
MPNIHPLFTHFPIALLSVSLAFDVIGVLRNNEQLERMGWWLQLLGTIGLAATVTSGLIAKAGVSIPEVGQTTFDAHQQIAFLVAALSTVLILWRIACRTRLPLKMRGL